ncbi:MAG TPA: hypothetical protein VKZ44_01605 [Taishania sp.]|nr:hypothetical protein [Taishania sp.]
MKKVLFASTLILFACNSNKDERFCECLKVGDELNTEAAKYGSIALDKITDEDVAKLKKLTTQKDSICEPFEVMGGEELLKKKEACK